MSINRKVLSLIWVAIMCAGPAFAVDFDESDLKEKPPVDDSQTKKLDAEVNDASMGAEIEAGQLDADRVATEQAKADEKRLKEELIILKQKTKDIESEKERVKTETKNAFQNLGEQQKRNKQAQKELEAQQKEKAAEDVKLGAVRNELQVVEDEAKSLAEEQRKIQLHIKMAKEEREAAVKRMTEMRAQATATKQRQAQQLKNIQIYRKKTQDFVERETAKTQAIAQSRSR